MLLPTIPSDTARCQHNFLKFKNKQIYINSHSTNRTSCINCLPSVPAPLPHQTVQKSFSQFSLLIKKKREESKIKKSEKLCKARLKSRVDTAAWTPHKRKHIHRRIHEKDLKQFTSLINHPMKNEHLAKRTTKLACCV